MGLQSTVFLFHQRGLAEAEGLEPPQVFTPSAVFKTAALPLG